MTTNEQIAVLLQQQTYVERMEMAAWLSDVLNEQKANMPAAEGFLAADIAENIETWAAIQLVEEEPANV